MLNGKKAKIDEESEIKSNHPIVADDNHEDEDDDD